MPTAAGGWALPLSAPELLGWAWQRWEIEVCHRELKAGFGLVTLKLLFLLALFFFTAPVVTHALAQACTHEGIEPVLAEDRRGRHGAAGAQPDDGRKP